MITQSVHVCLFICGLLVKVTTYLILVPISWKLCKVLRILGADTWHKLVEEVLFVNLWVIDDLADKTFLVFRIAEVHVSVVNIKHIRDSLLVFLNEIFLFMSCRYYSWRFLLLRRYLEVTLDADWLRFHQWWLRLLNWLCLDIYRRGLDLLRHKSLIETLAEWTHWDLLDINVDILNLSHNRLVLGVLDTFQRP